jgi:hypothetical protein
VTAKTRSVAELGVVGGGAQGQREARGDGEVEQGLGHAEARARGLK